MTPSAQTATRPDQGYLLSDPPAGAHLFSRTYRMRMSDIAQDRRLRLDAVARYLQDIAADMIEDSPFAETDPFWILRRTIIDVHEPISWPGNVQVERWCSATSSRWVDMRQRVRGIPEVAPFNPEERAPGLIETVSFCIKVDLKGQLSRISDAAQEDLSRHVTDTRLRWRALNTDPLPTASETDHTFPIRHTDIDAFDHVNNAIYWQIVEQEIASYAPELLTGPHRAVVEFLRPIPPGATVTVRTAKTEDGLALWILLDADGDAAEKVIAATVTVHPLGR